MDAINYVSLGLKNNEQLGSNNSASNQSSMKDFDYTDGLSLKELEQIDKNKDGVITEAEFKKAFGGKDKTAYKSYWDAYKEFHNATTQTTKNGYKTTQINTNTNSTVTSYFNEKGKMTHYIESATYTDGRTEQIKYEYVNGKAVKKSTTIKYPDGRTTTINEETKTQTNKSADGSSATYDKNGNLTKIKSGEETYKFSYNKNGQISSAEVNGKKYTNCTVKNNTTIIKDDNGNIIAKLVANNNGEFTVNEYSKGKKSKSTIINTDGEVEEIREFKDGKIVSKQFCDKNQIRKYSYDKNGNLTASKDYIDGKLYSSQTYSEKTGKWASRTLYDENGDISSYKEYSYKKNGDNVVKTTTTYDSPDKNTKKSKTTQTSDSYGNILSKETYNATTKNTTTTTYNYGSDKLTEKKTQNDLVSTTTTTNTTTTVKEYENGMVMKKETSSIEDGKPVTYTYEYIYHTNGKVLRVDKKDEQTGNTTTTCYDETGTKETERIEDSKGNLLSFKNNLTDILKQRYPNLTNAQITQLKTKCQEINNLSEYELISFNYDTEAYDIIFPTYKIENGELVFE